MEFVGIEKFSLVDYEGKVSCVLFFAGCNFRCPFCHNSSLINSKNNNPISFNSILEFLLTRRGLIDAVVISGGEPTLMDDLKDNISQIKALGYLIKLDTNGTNPIVLKDLIESNLIDYVAMDIKNSLEKYPLTTAAKVDLENIKESIGIIINSGIDHEFRTTVVKEFHSLEDMEKIASLIKGAKKMRIQKFVNNEACFRKDLHEIEINETSNFVQCIKKTINDTELRGY